MPLTEPRDFPVFSERWQLHAAFMIRCLFSDGTWRFTVENIATHRRNHYGSLEAVAEAIAVELSAEAPSVDSE